MLVYGDHHEQADPRSRAREVNRQLETIARMQPGLVRHAKLVGALVQAGKLLQGVADATFAEIGRDDRTDATEALTQVLFDLGRAVCRSWDSDFEEFGELPQLEASVDWPSEVELRVPEGYAFYAVYPEAYVEAARRIRLLAPPRVIGIRSIGTSLSAVVAAAVAAPPPVTFRPFGDPFARKVAISPALERALLGGDAHWLIVDEGPGQSGSSFAAVANWLLERSVPVERITLLPSHGGEPGAASSEELRYLWRRLHRKPADFGDRWCDKIARWTATVLGSLDAAPKDISGGAWRDLRYTRTEDRPALVSAWERRKFLVRAGGEPFLVKFAGLWRIGEEKLAIARTLHAEGLVPESIDLAHGFLIERWCEDAAPLDNDDKPAAEIGRYVGTRAKLLPAMSGSGASIVQLLEMIRRNVSLEFGNERARIIDRWQPRTRDLERRIVRVRTDNKLDRHEWLRSASGAFVKTDALDHHQAHDLIGCQDFAWDIAGAIVEFDLDQNCSDALVAAAEHSAGHAIAPALLEFYRIAYLAFRLGQCRLGASMTGDARERERLRGRGDDYARELEPLLPCSSASTRALWRIG